MMKRRTSEVLTSASLAFCALVCLMSCQRRDSGATDRLSVGAKLHDIEWVIVDTHDLGVGGQWVAKLTPQANAELIEELINAIENAAPGEPLSLDPGGWVVFKLKGGGIRAFNFCQVVAGEEVQIEPWFFSRAFGRAVIKIARKEIGWDKDNSLPRVKVTEVKVWRYGEFITALSPSSRGFDRLAEGACEVLEGFDPRVCAQEPTMGRDPRESAYYQGEPQFTFSLEKPLDMYKLSVRYRRAQETQVEYSTFASSVFAIYWSSFHPGIGGYHIAFRSDHEEPVWYAWNFLDALEALRTMGRPDVTKAFDKLLDAWKELAPASFAIPSSPDFSLWHVVSTQAIINACWNLNLPYRVVVDQEANWDNLKTFLTAEREPEEGEEQTYPSVLYISAHGNNKLVLDDQLYTVTRFWLSDGPVYATTWPPEGKLPEDYIFDQEHQRMKRNVISDPAYEKYGLKDPRCPWLELSQTGWVKFVWIDACYSNVAPGSQDMNDMARAFGMESDDNRLWFGDQSYIGFSSLTGNGFFNQWVSVVYTWTFWYYLSAWDGAAPAFPVYQVWAVLVPDQVTLWAIDYTWPLFVEYMVAISDISCPSWDAKLKDHR